MSIRFLCLIGILLAFAAVSQVAGEDAPVAKKTSPLELIPDDAIALVYTPNFRSLIYSSATTGFGRSFREPSMKQFIEWLHVGVAMKVGEGADPFDALLEMYGLLSGSAAIAICHSKDSDPVLGFAVQVNGDGSESVIKMRSCMTTLGITDWEEQDIAGVKVHTSDDVSIFARDGCLVGVISNEETVIEHWIKATGMVETPLAKAATRDNDLMRLCTISLNIEAFLDALLQRDQDVDNRLNMATMLGLTNLKLLVTDLYVRDGFFSEKMNITFEGEPCGIFALTAPPAEYADFKQVRGDATAFLRSRVCWDKVFQLLYSTGEFIAPEKVTGLQEAFIAAGGLDHAEFEKSLASSMRNDFILEIKAAENSFMPSYSMLIPCEKPEQVEKLLAAGNKMAPSSLRVLDFRGSRIFWAQYPKRYFELSSMLGFGCYVKDGALNVGNGPVGTKNLLVRDPVDMDISSNSGFAKLYSKLGHDVSTIGFINLKTICERTFPSIAQISMFMEGDELPLPSWPEIEQHITGIALTHSQLKERVSAESAGDIPLLSALTLVLPALVEYQIAQAKRRPDPIAMIDIENGEAGWEATNIESLNNMITLYDSASRHADAHEGIFPGSLNGLGIEPKYFICPKYTLREPDLNDLESTGGYFYFTGLKSGGERLPLVCERMCDAHFDKWIVIMTDGAVEYLPKDDFGIYVARYTEVTGVAVEVIPGGEIKKK